MLTSSNFDLARDGFGFCNPIGRVPDRTGGGLLRRSDVLVYGKGLCFGMAAAVLLTFSGQTTKLRRPLAGGVGDNAHSKLRWPKPLRMRGTLRGLSLFPGSSQALGKKSRICAVPSRP